APPAAARAAQGPIQIVGPRVVRALQRLSLAGLLDDDRASVPADVGERPLLAVGVPHEHNRNLTRPAWLDVPLSEAADVVPRAAENRLFLAREHRRVAGPIPGDRLRAGGRQFCQGALSRARAMPSVIQP